MRVLFLNQYFPPDPAPTGVLLRELAETLRAKGHDVDFVSAGQSYRGSGKQSGRRIVREFQALARILWRGLRARQPDLVFSGSSPPCLLFATSLVALWHRARSIHWMMDMYPEIALALGELRDGPLFRTVRALMGWCYRQADAVVVLDADMAARLADHGITARLIVPPWVAEGIRVGGETPGEPFTWIYSGNLGRAHEWRTLLGAQRIIEERGLPIQLHFQGGGPSWAPARAEADRLGLRQIEWQPYVPSDELVSSLSRRHVLAVTQRPETQGLLWPSKLALASSLGRPILWIGPKDGAIARDLARSPASGIFEPGEDAAIAAWLERLHGEPGQRAAGVPLDADPGQTRRRRLEALVKLVEETGPAP